jgi:hypothetical protein
VQVLTVVCAERLTDARRAHDAELSDSEDELGDRRRDVQTRHDSLSLFLFLSL